MNTIDKALKQLVKDGILTLAGSRALGIDHHKSDTDYLALIDNIRENDVYKSLLLLYEHIKVIIKKNGVAVNNTYAK